MQHGRPPHTLAQFVAPAKNRRNNYYPRDKVTGEGGLPEPSRYHPIDTRSRAHRDRITKPWLHDPRGRRSATSKTSEAGLLLMLPRDEHGHATPLAGKLIFRTLSSAVRGLRIFHFYQSTIPSPPHSLSTSLAWRMLRLLYKRQKPIRRHVFTWRRREGKFGGWLKGGGGTGSLFRN